MVVLRVAEQALHVGQPRRAPRVEVSVEARLLEHAAHAPHARHVPAVDVLVEWAGAELRRRRGRDIFGEAPGRGVRLSRGRAAVVGSAPDPAGVREATVLKAGAADDGGRTVVVEAAERCVAGGHCVVPAVPDALDKAVAQPAALVGRQAVLPRVGVDGAAEDVAVADGRAARLVNAHGKRRDEPSRAEQALRGTPARG